MTDITNEVFTTQFHTVNQVQEGGKRNSSQKAIPGKLCRVQ